eukprot:CAMPEP_0204368162 /NCGR_PEP_ID=MMETSP0469-20131031/43981_1 /ASSEMBLY_ACC=CAM_ASM_000384 /TAXON_ID=2969 /ORGANISM="Oxyrrhis marina" /LENGTH=241 /DNA_ID=CAMNT_0051357679 /DNA_START=96 /DNA_END=821 /DNA_ORIENTATION=+
MNNSVVLQEASGESWTVQGSSLAASSARFVVGHTNGTASLVSRGGQRSTRSIKHAHHHWEHVTAVAADDQAVVTASQDAILVWHDDGNQFHEVLERHAEMSGAPIAVSVSNGLVALAHASGEVIIGLVEAEPKPSWKQLAVLQQPGLQKLAVAQDASGVVMADSQQLMFWDRVGNSVSATPHSMGSPSMLYGLSTNPPVAVMGTSDGSIGLVQHGRTAWQVALRRGFLNAAVVPDSAVCTA